MRLRFLFFFCLLILPPNAQAQTRLEIAESVFISAQRLQNSSAGQALAQSALRIASGRPDLAVLVRTRQDRIEQVDKLSEQIVKLAAQTGAESEVEMAKLQKRLRTARSEIAGLERSLALDFPDYLELTEPRPMSVAQVQAVLNDDEAMLMNYSDGSYTYLWAISKTDFGWHRANIAPDELTSLVKQLRVDLSGEGAVRSGIALNPSAIKRRKKSFGRQISFRLYSEIFKPLEPIFGEAGHLLMVFQGALTSLPPAVLVTSEPQGEDENPDDLRDTDWLIKKHALTTLPSVGAIRALRSIKANRGAVKSGNSFVGFGDPVLGYKRDGQSTQGGAKQITTRGVYDGLTEVANLAPLPNTERELREIAKIIGEEVSSVFLGANATETNVKNSDLSDATVIAFATHGLLANGLPGLAEPALVFTPPDAPSLTDDALLTATEAASLKLSAELIILSACDTAGSDGTPGAEGLSGLARAFIYAGAQSILVSHWPVDDLAARRLTTGMLNSIYLGSGEGRAYALQSSILDLMADQGKPEFAHPSIWAPFVIVGEGA